MITKLFEEMIPEESTVLVEGLSRINFIIGMNGCGKSTYLRRLPNGMTVSQQKAHVEFTYIEPERGGSLQNDPNAVNRSPQGGQTNQDPAFRQKVLSEFNELHRTLLLELDDNKSKYSSNTEGPNLFLKPLNTFLPEIEISFARSGDLEVSVDGKTLSSKPSSGRNRMQQGALDALSSGQLEAISLGIKILNFAFLKSGASSQRILLIDSPDAHFHPDLQRRFSNFVYEMCLEHEFQTIIASHSTAMLDIDNDDLRVSFVNKESLRTRSTPLKFIAPNGELNRVLPIFGAHPLSQAFNEKPILLVEGDDDVRVWEQVQRTSNGSIAFFPCATDSITKMNRHEELLDSLLPSVYESPLAFSLRDKDDSADNSIANLTHVKRAKLNCRAAENLFLTDDVLVYLSTTWKDVKNDICLWLKSNDTHKFFDEMKKFKEDGFDRQNADLKKIRNILLGILPTSKPWEVLVGQVVAKQAMQEKFSETHLAEFIGKDMIEFIETVIR